LLAIYDGAVNDATVLVVGDLAWPVVVLVLVCLLLATQRKPIGDLINRVKSFSVPGGSAELAPAVPEGEADTILALVDRLTRNVSERADRGEVRAADDDTADNAVDNREPKAEFEPPRDEEVTNLVMLRTKVANLLSELAVPPPPGGIGPVTATIDVLVGRGVLDASTAQALRDTVVVADQAAAGATVPQRVAVAVENAGSAILEQLAVLRTTAAASFEDYVLDQLQERVPDGWAVDLDRSIPTGPSGAISPQAPGRARHIWVDALVRADERSAVVEVRARLQQGAPGQIESVRSWVEALPPDLPILLVMLGDGLTVREQQLIEGGREGSLRILLWDLEADRLMPELRRLLAGSSIDLLSVPLQA
jgi:hypothetical protein